MTTRLRTTLVALFAVAGLASGTMHATATPSVDSPAAPVGATANDGPSTWACVAVSYVNVGACVRNPFHGKPTPRDIVGGVVDDVTGG